MLREHLNGYKVILASASPRRQQFFRDLDIDFEIRLKEVEEIYPPELKEVEITDFLAQLKADAFVDDIGDNEIIVTSDTIVWHQDKALGKPVDFNDAFDILSKLSASTHQVFTSVCFKSKHGSEVINEMTKVTFGSLTADEIRYYLNNHNPYDKAGAYGIQDWIGLVAVTKIEGSYANVMGMPTDKVYEYLSKFNRKNI